MFKEHGVVEAKGVEAGLIVFEVVTPGEPAQRDRQRASYLDAVVRAHKWIDLGGLAPQVGTELLRVSLDDIFVHLSAHRRTPQLDHYSREEIRLRREFQDSKATPVERERRLRQLAERADQRYSKGDGA